MKPKSADVAAIRAALDLLDAHPDPEAEADIPVAALVLDESGAVIGRGWNRRAALSDPTAHAEVLALREAASSRDTWRLSGCTLVVTLEPCPMCAGAATAARIDRVVFGAFNPDYGAAGSLFDVVRDPRLPHRAEVVAGVLAQECSAPIHVFFASRRAR